MPNRILFDGCSFTANSGFDESNRLQHHWPVIFSNHYKSYYQNSAIGGSSNEEILYRTIENCNRSTYDLVIIMWSAVGRKWVYFSENNVDDFTIITGAQITGFNHLDHNVLNYAKLHYAHFNNEYTLIKQWLLNIIVLEKFFRYKKQKYIFAKGFDNFLTEIEKSNFSTESGSINLSHRLKRMLDFDNRSDRYIKEKLDNLKFLLQEIKTYNWVNFDSLAFWESAIDRAEGNSHPGPLSNLNFATKLISYCECNKLLQIKS